MTRPLLMKSQCPNFILFGFLFQQIHWTEHFQKPDFWVPSIKVRGGSIVRTFASNPFQKESLSQLRQSIGVVTFLFDQSFLTKHMKKSALLCFSLLIKTHLKNTFKENLFIARPKKIETSKLKNLSPFLLKGVKSVKFFNSTWPNLFFRFETKVISVRQKRGYCSSSDGLSVTDRRWSISPTLVLLD